MVMSRGRILVVDDDQFYQEFCSTVLSDAGYMVRTTFTGEEALELLKGDGFEVMLADMVMPGMDGMDLLERAKQTQPDLDVIIMTGYASVETAVKTLKSGASDYLTKPLNPEELKITVKRTLELRHLFDENSELKNLLTLYETCQRLNSCMEIERLYGLSLDAIMQGLRGDAGMASFRISQDDDFELNSYRGMEEDEARSLLDYLLHNDLAQMPEHVINLDLNGTAGENTPLHFLRIRSAIILPFPILGKLEGMIMIFKKDPKDSFDLMDMGSARFIAEQVSLSLENALRYNEAQRLIFIDDLTSLFNTRYLDLNLQNEIKRAKRNKSHLSLLFIDLDFFKDVNDNYGHLVGSKVLVKMADILHSCLRDIDIVVRYGGDEFIVLLTETDCAGAEKVAERIRDTVENYTFDVRPDLNLRLTCSVGISTFPDDADNKTDLINLADKAMYRGKETTRNVVYSATNLQDSSPDQAK